MSTATEIITIIKNNKKYTFTIAESFGFQNSLDIFAIMLDWNKVISLKVDGKTYKQDVFFSSDTTRFLEKYRKDGFDEIYEIFSNPCNENVLKGTLYYHTINLDTKKFDEYSFNEIKGTMIIDIFS